MTQKIARSALFNLLGGVIPALISLMTVPIILKGLGETGYGVFTLITTIVGYFALLDINITSGSVKYISEYNAKKDFRKISETITFGLVIYAGIGLVGGALIFIFANFLVTSVFKVPVQQMSEATHSLRIAALGFLLGQLQIYLQSIPQSLLRYDVSSKLEVLFGVLVPLLTVGVLFCGYGLYEIILLRVLASGINCIILWKSICRILKEFEFALPSYQIRKSLLEFSSYSFLSRIAALSYMYADRLIIGAMIGMKELAYYSVAATLANRILSLTYRLSTVLFPASSDLAARGEVDRLRSLYLKANRYVTFINASGLVLIVLCAESLLTHWIDKNFSLNGWVILAVMAASQFVDSLTNLPSLVNDGLGHPKVSGSFALIRACIGLAFVYIFVKFFGIQGAAWAHFVSSLLLTIVFVGYVHGRTVPCSLKELIGQSYRVPFLSISAVALIAVVLSKVFGGGEFLNVVIVLLSVLMQIMLGIGFVLMDDDRDMFLRWVRGRIVRMQ